MKIRNGFVSNSSSSSFIILIKDGKKLTDSKLLKVFGVDEKSPLNSLVKGISKEIVASCSEMSYEEYKSNYMWENSTDEEFEEDCKDCYNIYKEAKENNWKIYHGSVDSCEQQTLCELELHYEDDTIKIEKEGGY